MLEMLFNWEFNRSCACRISISNEFMVQVVRHPWLIKTNKKHTGAFGPSGPFPFASKKKLLIF